MDIKKKTLPLSVVIPSLGHEVLLKTIKSLNRGEYNPSEIIVCIPEGVKVFKSVRKIKNVKILNSPIKGQVHQRIYGLRNVIYRYVLLLDDDTILSSKDLETLVHNLDKLGPGNALSPVNYDINNMKSVTIRRETLKTFIYDVFTYLIAGSRWGVNKMGTISKSGVVFGIDPDYLKNKIFFKREWLSGCCIAMFKEDLILKNFYPFEGKAYFEDVIHSIILNQNNIKLWTLISTICYTNIENFNLNFKEIDRHFERQKFSVILLNNNLTRFYIWSFIYRLYLQIKYFISKF